MFTQYKSRPSCELRFFLLCLFLLNFSLISRVLSECWSEIEIFCIEFFLASCRLKMKQRLVTAAKRSMNGEIFE